MLGTDKEITDFKVGGTTFVNTPIIFEYFKVPILAYKIVEGQALLDVFIPDKTF